MRYLKDNGLILFQRHLSTDRQYRSFTIFEHIHVNDTCLIFLPIDLSISRESVYLFIVDLDQSSSSTYRFPRSFLRSRVAS